MTKNPDMAVLIQDLHLLIMNLEEPVGGISMYKVIVGKPKVP